MKQPRICIAKLKSAQNVEIFYVVTSLINCMYNYKKEKLF